MDLIKTFTDWRDARAAYNHSFALVRAFYGADPLSNERRNILQELIAAEKSRPDTAKKIDLRLVPERTTRITSEFKKSTGGAGCLHGIDGRDAERRHMINVLIVCKDVKGAARAVVEDRIETTGLAEMASMSFIPRSWGGRRSRRADRTERLLHEALTCAVR